MYKALFFSAALFSAIVFSALNPAYEFCVQHGGTIETRADSVGNQFGICMFDIDGVKSECNQWEFVRGACKPGQCLLWSVETKKCEKMIEARRIIDGVRP